MKSLYVILLICSILCSCRQNESKEARSINQSTQNITTLKKLVISKGDSSAYYDLFYEFVDRDEQYSDLLYYSYIMAFKYHYARGYWDTFDILCKMYNVDVSSKYISLDKMDIETKNLALECIKRLSEINYLDSKKIYQRMRHSN